MSKYLKLIAKTDEDLKVISAHLQDSIVSLNDMANLKKNKDLIAEADKVISELRDAWAEMLTQNPENPQQPPPQSGSEPGSFSLRA